MAEDRIDQIANDVSYIRARVDVLVAQSADHEMRLRGLERLKNRAGGVGAVITLVLALLGISNS